MDGEADLEKNLVRCFDWRSTMFPLDVLLPGNVKAQDLIQTFK